MPKAWKEWEGRVVNKEFRLGDYLGGSERAGVFMTQYGPESLKTAVKLIPVGSWNQEAVEAELSRLQSASGLSHAHLLRIFESGRATLDDTELIFVVTEYADEDLSQILPNRSLAPAEIREMLGPALEALSYLHGRGFVHGHVKPANVMAIGDQLKLSSDGISSSGQSAAAPGERSEYDAPEAAQGQISPAIDVWSLGMLLVMALAQRLPDWDAGGTEALIPSDVPVPFDDIVRHCLRRDAAARCGIEEIAARLGLPIAERAAAKPELVRPAPVRRAAPGPQLAPQVRKTNPAPPRMPAKREMSAGAYVAVLAVLFIVGVLVVPRMFRSGKISSPAANPASDSARGQTLGRRPAGARSEIAEVSDDAESAETSGRSNLPSGREVPERPSPTRGKARRGLTAGEVAEQVVPDVPKSARDTIRGTVRVGVRLSVDTAGNVTQAELDSPGPSKYFAQVALEAAQQWKFDPPKMQGQNVLSDWLLRFQFTGQGTKVIPVQSDP